MHIIPNRPCTAFISSFVIGQFHQISSVWCYADLVSKLVMHKRNIQRKNKDKTLKSAKQQKIRMF